MTEETNIPILYILLRNDLESMNFGKGSAQTCHAGSVFANHTKSIPEGNNKDLITKWENETHQGFGTVLVLAVNECEMRTAVNVANAVGLICEVIHDPTYPVRDGKVCHFLPIDTCGYIFGGKNDPMLKAIVGNFSLHP